MAQRRKIKSTFKPPKKPYVERSNSYVLSAIKTAQQTSDTIRELSEELESSHAINTESIDHYIALYKGQVDLGIPDTKRYVHFDLRSSKAPDIVHRIQGMLMSPLKPHYIAPKASPKDQDLAEMIDQYLEATYRWLARKYQMPFDQQSLFWQILAGKGFIQQTHLPSYWDKDWRKREAGEAAKSYNQRNDSYKASMGPPFHVESLDPRIVFPIMTPQGASAWVKKYTVQRFQAEDAFRKSGQPIHIKMTEGGSITDVVLKTPGIELPEQEADAFSGAVTYYEYIDEEMVYYQVADRIVHKYNHGGGLKIFPAWGLVTGFKDWATMAVSVLYGVRNELPQYDFLRTLWAQKAYITVFPQLFAELGAGEEALRDSDNNPEEWRIEPMSIKQVRGKLRNIFAEAESGMDFKAVVDSVAADIDLATLPGIARGVAGAQQPGYAINQLQQQLRTIWKPIIESREDQWGGIFEHNLYCIVNCIEEETSVFAETVNEDTGQREGEYISIAPDDIQHFYLVRAELKPDLPIDTQGNMLSWIKAAQDGFATDEEVSREGFNKPNWRARRRQIERDIGRRTLLPEVINDAKTLGKVALQNKVAQALGLDKINPAFSQPLDQMRAAAGGTPTGGAPGQGNEPPAAGMPPDAQQMMAQQAAAGGGGIPPTTGANPNNPTPGPRL